ncbi:MAG: group 1 truncated hemoglobin [Lewinellaceae bacterium]|nr:group 1 truncated hemoglobin [Saprospiraceae bacterium]MCB9306547.1 group 1 truncated hemoglobin [Lewinellaceae bacterium]MCB9355379.1 group 1 truncated hemoglobin [Lewinellaceae bacterium]
MIKHTRIPALLLFVALFFAACKDQDGPLPQPDPTLYERLGGVDAIALVVDKFLANVVADDAINARFAATVADPFRTQLLRNNLIDQICAGTGGPCQYKGKTMLEAHTGMNITDAEFNALVGDLVAALDFYNVPQQEQDELLAILGPMKSDIVGQ